MKSIITMIRTVWEKNWPEFHAALTGGLPQFVFASRPRDLGSSIPAFSYHVVDAKGFKADLDYLSQNGYITIDADTLLKHLEQRERAPHRAVVLTFDDGSRNLYHVAYPLLRHYGMKAVAFVAPRFHREKFEELSSVSDEHLLHPLSWSQIREMHSSGIIDFQSHTYEHRYVPRWPEPAYLEGVDPVTLLSLRGPAMTVEEDFRVAKEKLEQKLNKTVRHLAFPCFNGTADALRIGHALGYEAFWWGVLPHRPINRPGQKPSYVVRIDGRYLRRLPGDKRVSLTKILRTRYRKSGLRTWGHFRDSLR